MFKKIMIANRGDKRCEAELAVKAHAGVAGVMPQPNRMGRAATCDRAAGA
jgi:hypothetical protein